MAFKVYSREPQDPFGGASGAMEGTKRKLSGKSTAPSIPGYPKQLSCLFLDIEIICENMFEEETRDSTAFKSLEISASVVQQQLYGYTNISPKKT